MACPAVKTKIRKLWVVFSISGLTASCAQMDSHEAIQDPSIRMAVENAVTQCDHYVLAEHFEDAARKMLVKVEEKKALLEQYEKIRLYGWQSHNLKSRTSVLIRKYEQAAQSNMRHASSQRQKAHEFEGQYLRHDSL